ncbi:MAG: 30S ribosome-binding factor RbfA [Alphaproteobacteria bacterium]|jgi:ribosome-binding factor A|nr:30S ribosome-binding factor RbfA [Alphaproteobacteria bacterium]
MSRRLSMTARHARAPSQRQLRVGEEIRHSLSAILMRGDLRDPVLKDASITVTEVRISPDMRNATAFILPLGGEHAPEVLEALKRAAPFLRAQVAHAVRLKFAPALMFELDTSFDHAERITRLLHSEPVARDLREPAADEDGDEDSGGGERHGA